MGAKQIKERLHLRIEQADSKLLRVLDQFTETLFAEYHSDETSRLNDDEIIGYQVGSNKPILAGEADNIFEAIVDDVKQGNFIEIDDLIAKKSAKW